MHSDAILERQAGRKNHRKGSCEVDAVQTPAVPELGMARWEDLEFQTS